MSVDNAFVAAVSRVYTLPLETGTLKLTPSTIARPQGIIRFEIEMTNPSEFSLGREYARLAGRVVNFEVEAFVKSSAQ